MLLRAGNGSLWKAAARPAPSSSSSSLCQGSTRSREGASPGSSGGEGGHGRASLWLCSHHLPFSEINCFLHAVFPSHILLCPPKRWVVRGGILSGLAQHPGNVWRVPKTQLISCLKTVFQEEFVICRKLVYFSHKSVFFLCWFFKIALSLVLFIIIYP